MPAPRRAPVSATAIAAAAAVAAIAAAAAAALAAQVQLCRRPVCEWRIAHRHVFLHKPLALQFGATLTASTTFALTAASTVVARQSACGHVPRGLPADGGGGQGAQRGVARRPQRPSRRQPRRVRPPGCGLVHDGHGQAHAVACAGRGFVRHDGGGLAGDGAPGPRRRAGTGHGVLRRGRCGVPRLLPQRVGRRVRVLVRRWRHHDDFVQAAERAALLRRLLLDGRCRGAAAAAAAAAHAAVLRDRVG